MACGLWPQLGITRMLRTSTTRKCRKDRPCYGVTHVGKPCSWTPNYGSLFPVTCMVCGLWPQQLQECYGQTRRGNAGKAVLVTELRMLASLVLGHLLRIAFPCNLWPMACGLCPCPNTINLLSPIASFRENDLACDDALSQNRPSVVLTLKPNWEYLLLTSDRAK